ncbi:MFS transporter [Luteococcus peritonei]|uniref:MFS transporter n=1 Tax=Luteococcus peritonei TaxID=88874 RepID=A0ABW4RUC6_9ACTN
MPTHDATVTAPAAEDLERVQRRVVRVLFGAQVLAGLGMGAGMSIGSLLAYEVTSNEALAGISRIISGLSVAVLAVPLARLATTHGRRVALGTGWAVASLGALLLVAAIASHSVALLMLGMFAFSAGSAAGLQARFAATDLARPEHRARTLSLVVWATTLGSMLGPNLAAPGAVVGRWLGIADIAGAYLLAALGTVLSAGFVLATLRPDPLLLARGKAPAGRPTGSLAMVRSAWHQPELRLALVTVACAQFVMASVMVLTPVHMSVHHHSLAAVGLTMSIHIAGMYALSPLVGMAVDRAGERFVVVAGVGVLAASLLTAWFAGTGAVLLNLALFLLGLGWSMCSVAGSALVTRVAPDADRPQLQASADTASNLSAALAAALCGPVMGLVGYRGLAAFAALALVPVVVVLLSAARRRS